MSEQSKKPVTTPKTSPSAIALQPLLQCIQEAPDIKSINSALRKQILDVFQAEMAAIFLANVRKQELVSWLLLPGDSLEKIVMPISTDSIVGFAAKKKQPINLRNAYDFSELRRVGPELNFSSTYDEKVGVRTKQILAIPIVQNNTLMGVIEFINKRDDTEFTSEEEHKVNQLAKALASAFSNLGIFGKQTPPKYESLLAQKLLSRKELEQGLAKAAELGKDPETVLMNNFQIPRLKMGKLLAEFYSTRFVDLDKVDINPKKLFPGINIDYFEKEELAPLSLRAGKLVVAVKKIEEQTLTSAMREQVPGVNQVELVFAFQEDIRSFWKHTRAKYFSRPKGVSEGQQLSMDTSLFDALEDNKPQKKERLSYDTSLFDSLEDIESQEEEQLSFDTSLFDALEEIEPQEKVREKRVTAGERRVRPEKRAEMNDDTNEPPVVQPPNAIIKGGYSSQASDIQIEPHSLKDKEIELRLAATPTAKSNEDIELRIISDPKPLLLLDELIPSRLLAPFKEIIEKKQGMILVVGPKASGKTTTLHSVLNHLNTAGKKICTAEYPVEIQHYGIRQVQVDPLRNYTFADALREFRKEDPEVIMIGEMQDLRTALMAVDVALNGHLLLTSLAANSAAEGVIHCLDMGLDPMLLAAALHGVLAQRLVRTLCKYCKQPYHPERAEYDRLLGSYGISFFDHINVMYSDDLVFHRASGCPKCNDSGYLGRTGLYELLVVNPIIRELIMELASPGEIVEEAMINDMTLLLQEGIQLIFKGTIDCKELMSVCPF